jgi:hypothetical protein
LQFNADRVGELRIDQEETNPLIVNLLQKIGSACAGRDLKSKIDEEIRERYLYLTIAINDIRDRTFLNGGVCFRDCLKQHGSDLLLANRLI